VKKRKGNEGYDVAKSEYTDLVKAGIVDPTKVTRSALQNAASISGLLLTTEAIITEAPEKEKAGAGGMPGGGMGGMGGMGRHGLLIPKKFGTKPTTQKLKTINCSRVSRGARLFCV
jgi:hypothetical protein